MADLANFPYVFANGAGNIPDADEMMSDLQHLRTYVNSALDASNITAGTIDTARLPTIPSANLVNVPATSLAVVPAARVYHSANQSIAFQVEMSVAFNSERFDTDTIHDTVTNNTRLTCKTAGLYLISGSVYFTDGLTNSTSSLTIRLNGATELAIQSHIDNDTGEGTRGLNVATPYVLAVNDYVELRAFASMTGGEITKRGNASPEFSMVYLGRVA